MGPLIGEGEGGGGSNRPHPLDPTGLEGIPLGQGRQGCPQHGPTGGFSHRRHGAGPMGEFPERLPAPRVRLGRPHPVTDHRGSGRHQVGQPGHQRARTAEGVGRSDTERRIRRPGPGGGIGNVEPDPVAETGFG